MYRKTEVANVSSFKGTSLLYFNWIKWDFATLLHTSPSTL